MKLYQGIVGSLLATTGKCIQTLKSKRIKQRIVGHGQRTLGATGTLSDADVKDVLTNVVSAHSMVRNAPLSEGIVAAIRSQELFVEEVFKMRVERLLQGGVHS